MRTYLGIGGWLLAVWLAVQAPRDLVDLRHVVVDMHWQPHNPRLLGDAPRHRLPDPPVRVRRELEALGGVKLLDRLLQADCAFRNQIA